jgi:hypothetical protein
MLIEASPDYMPKCEIFGKTKGVSMPWMIICPIPFILIIIASGWHVYHNFPVGEITRKINPVCHPSALIVMGFGDIEVFIVGLKPTPVDPVHP